MNMLIFVLTPALLPRSLPFPLVRACRLLRVLEESHKLRVHLRAVRRYLLLGQGDLFMFLMEDLRCVELGTVALLVMCVCV